MKMKKKSVTVWIAGDGTEHSDLATAKAVDILLLLERHGFEQDTKLGTFIREGVRDPELVMIIKSRNQPQRSLV
jgi:hypothetical protein